MFTEITITFFDPLTIYNYRPGSIVIDYDVNTKLFNSPGSSSQIGELLKNKTLQLEINTTLGDMPLTPSYITTTTVQMLQTGKHNSSVSITIYVLKSCKEKKAPFYNIVSNDPQIWFR